MTWKSLFDAAGACLAAREPEEKLALTARAVAGWRAGELTLDGSVAAEPIGEQPGLPARLRLVRPRELPQRRPDTVEGRAVLFHALTHIEFVAIGLAWDAVYRFRDLPADYYDDWVRVAEEEAYHFTMLREHLNGLGADYGDWPAHNGLWEMARKTADDPLVRMALVPRCLEARGLDVNPGIRARLAAVGDERGTELLDIILRDEIGHVAIGDRWFRHLCAERTLAPEETYRTLIADYLGGWPRGPYHLEARRRAGFSERELSSLEGNE